MKQQISQRLRPILAVLAGAMLLGASGCSQQKSSSSGGWTQSQAAAFRGAPPTAEDRKEMAVEIQKARQGGQANPPGFASAAPAPKQ